MRRLILVALSILVVVLICCVLVALPVLVAPWERGL